MLHNRLVGYLFDCALQDRPVLSRSYAEFFHRAFLVLAADVDMIDEPILDFFLLIQNYDVGSQSFARLTPLVLKPDPNAFYRFKNRYPRGEMKGVILLYPGARDSENEGLLFNTRTGLAYWVTAPNWPLRNDWVPLEMVLQRWVDWWRFGKYCRMRGSLDLGIVPWTAQDLNASVDAWMILLQTIHRHSPMWATNPARLRFGPPVSPSLVWKLSRHSFAFHFLVRAFQPPFRYIAPGMQALTDFTVRDMLQGDSQDCFGGEDGLHRKDESGELPCILFPSDRSVRLCRAFSAGCRYRASWEGGESIVPDSAGVYLTPCESMGDGVTFLERTGRHDSFQYRGPCPWGPGRHVKLVELLQQWTELVESGVWEVGYDGVKGGQAWFDVQHASERQFLDGTSGWEEGNEAISNEQLSSHDASASQSSGNCSLSMHSGTFWGSEDEKAQGGIFQGVCLRQSWLDSHF